MKDNFIFIVAATLFLLAMLPLCSASIESLGTFRQGTCIDLKQGCGNCTMNNITSITQPNGIQIIYSPELSMDRRGTDFNATFCTTGQIGKYIINGYGDKDGNAEVWVYSMIVNTSGEDINSHLPLILLVVSFIIFIIALWQKNDYLGFMAGTSFIVSGVFLMIYGLENVASAYTRGLAAVILGLGLIVIIVSGYETITEDNEED